MNDWLKRFHLTPFKIGILVATVGLAWGSLLIARPAPVPAPQVGDPAPDTFYASRTIDIEDEAATEARREEAAAAVEDIYQLNEGKLEEVRLAITTLFGDVRAGMATAEDAIPPPPTTTIPEPPTTLPPEDGTETTVPAVLGEVHGLVFVDADGSGEYLPELGDGPLQGISVALILSDGSVRTVTTDVLGQFSVSGLPSGRVVVHIDYSEASFPDLLAPSTGPFPEIDLEEGGSVEVPAIGFRPVTEAPLTQEALLQQKYPLLRSTTITKLVALVTGDVARAALGESAHLDVLEREAIRRAEQVMADEIRTIADKNNTVRTLYLAPQTVFFDDGTFDPEAGAGVSDIVANTIEVNSFIDQEATEAAREAARAGVDAIVVTFAPRQRIVEQGEPITAVQLDALVQLELLESGRGPSSVALLLVVGVTVVLLSVYLLRFRPALWALDRRVALFGLLLVLAALAARMTAVVQGQIGNPAVAFLMPAAALGLMAAILFDARIAVLLGLAVGVLTALATEDAAIILFAGLATLAPVPFASAISSRHDLRRAVVLSAVALAAAAAPIAWLFYGGETPLIAIRDGAAAAFVNGLIGSMVGVAALSFLEVIFDVTTRLRLLDLTDRNHPALQLLEERARGTFNHSLMVGTLADAAARAVEANNLLARSAAYYHDLGKTENPSFYIENQFAGFNPHDQLLPEESAQIIRQHVIDGIRLAKEYHIPTDVTEGILTHHGDGIMRFFYHKALERFGEGSVDVEAFRHIGHKPTSREMAILMMADAVEGACRAVFAEKDPSPEAITGVVERVIGEKMADGQLSESALTMGDLTRAKEAFIDALIGNYHQRITYPSFPRLQEGAIAGALGTGPGVAASPVERKASDDEDPSLADIEWEA